MIGCTPGEWGDEETFDTRGQEIQRWLEDNAVEPYRFVIIDDFIKRQFNLLAPFTSPVLVSTAIMLGSSRTTSSPMNITVLAVPRSMANS